MAELDIKFKWKNLSQRKALFIGRTLENVFSLLPKRFEPPLTRYSVCTLAFNRTLDLTKAKNELNYKPIVSMHKALELSVLNMKKDLQGG
jgi:hypothetical protein